MHVAVIPRPGVGAQGFLTDLNMRTGFAERDITPNKGLEMPGASRRTFHDGIVHDPCKARAAVFDDGVKRVALVSVDAVLVSDCLVRAARGEIADRCGIPPESVMIAATHSHSAGPLGLYQPGQFDHAPGWVQELAYERSSCADEKYLNYVREQIVIAVSEANETRIEAQCGVAIGHEPKAAFNRRFRMRNGLTYTFPGQGNPDILEPAGPIDPAVGALGAWDAEGRLRGCVINYACHPTTKPGGASADWIFYLEQVIRGALGPDVVVLFLNGACGDIAPVDTLSRYTAQTGDRWARRIGGRVGAEAVKTLLDAVLGELRPVTSRSLVLRIPRRQPKPAHTEWALDIVKHNKPNENPMEWFFASEVVLLDALLAKEQEAAIEVQAIQIGPAVFLGSPGELFCQLGLDLKAASHFPFTFPVSLANGFCGYLPTTEAMGPNGGGYETRLTGHTNLEVAASVKVVGALVELAAGLTAGQIPEPPPLPMFTTSWNFGNVPAEPWLAAKKSNLSCRTASSLNDANHSSRS